VLIRAATPADIPEIRALERQADTAAHWALREYDALFAPEAPQRIALVAADDGALCGFAIARCARVEWEIENVMVAGAHRRRGVGRELVREILQAARDAEISFVLLEVRESNLAARQLYEALGFAQIGRRTGYYHEPNEDALVLRYSVRNL